MSFDELVQELSLDASDFESGTDSAGSAAQDFSNDADDLGESLIDLDPAGAAAGAGVAAAGAGIQGMLDDTADMRGELSRVGEGMGLTSDEANDLATSMSNATFPLEDVQGSMSALAGITDTPEQMRETALAADNIADATGSSASEISENLAPAVNALDGDLDALIENQDAFTIAANESGMSIDDIGATLQKLDFSQLDEMGLSADQTAGLMAEFADETGYSGQLLEQNFNSAINEADGDLGALTEELGLGENAVEDWEKKVEEGAGATDDYATAANSSLSTMDKMRSKIDDAKLSMSGYLQPISSIAPVMMAAGSAMTMFSTINMGAVVPSITATMGALAPLLPAIIGLTVAGAALYGAWETNFLGIQDIVGDVMESIRSAIDGALGFITDLWDTEGQRIMQSASQSFERVETVIEETLGRIYDSVIRPILDNIRTFWNENGEEIRTSTVETFEKIGDVVDSTLGYIYTAVIQPILATISEVWATHGDDLMRETTETFDHIAGVVDSTLGFVWREVISPILTAISDMWATHGDAIVSETTETFDHIAGKVRTVLEWLSPYIEAVMGTILDVVTVVLDRLGEFWDDHGDTIMTVVESTLGVVMTLFEQALDTVLTVVRTTLALVRGDFDEAGELITDLVDRTVGRVVDLFWDLYNTLVGNSIVPDMIGEIIAVFENLYDFIKDVWDFLGAVTGVFGDAKEAALGVIDSLYDDTVGRLGELIERIGELAGDAADTFKDGFNAAIPDSVGVPEVTIGGGTFAGKDLPSTTVGGGSMDMPRLNTGGEVDETGPAMVHAGERVLSPAETRQVRKGDLGGSGPTTKEIEQATRAGVEKALRGLSLGLNVETNDDALDEWMRDRASLVVDSRFNSLERERKRIKRGRRD